jgi:hypothetical protein
MRTNTCTILTPQTDYSPSVSPTNEEHSPQGRYSPYNNQAPQSVFIPDTSYIQREPTESKMLQSTEHRFKKKIPKYDNMITHFSFK